MESRLLERWSMSHTDRALACMHWLRPDVPVEKLLSGPAAKIGILVHALNQCAIEGRRFDEAIHLTPAQVKKAQELFESLQWYRDSLVGAPVLRCEVAIAYDVETEVARLLGNATHRDYGALGPNEIAGTADVVFRDDKGRLYIDDVKTGSFPYARESGQLWTLGLAFARYYMVDEIAVRNIAPSGVDAYELTGFDLDAHAARLHAVPGRIEGAEPNPGSHCKYCPAMTCEGKRRAA